MSRDWVLYRCTDCDVLFIIHIPIEKAAINIHARCCPLCMEVNIVFKQFVPIDTGTFNE